MLMMIYRVGRFVLVWVKLGIRLQSWRRGPGNVRIDKSSRTGVLGLCGGEHTLHGPRWRDYDWGKGRRGKDGGYVVVEFDPGNAVYTSLATGNSGG